MSLSSYSQIKPGNEFFNSYFKYKEIKSRQRKRAETDKIYSMHKKHITGCVPNLKANDFTLAKSPPKEWFQNCIQILEITMNIYIYIVTTLFLRKNKSQIVKKYI